jgi:hypothetical protein
MVLAFALDYQRVHRSSFCMSLRKLSHKKAPRIEENSRRASHTPVSWGSMNAPPSAYQLNPDAPLSKFKKRCTEGYELPIILLYVLYLTAIYCEFT